MATPGNASCAAVTWPKWLILAKWSKWPRIKHVFVSYRLYVLKIARPKSRFWSFSKFWCANSRKVCFVSPNTWWVLAKTGPLDWRHGDRYGACLRAVHVRPGVLATPLPAVQPQQWHFCHGDVRSQALCHRPTFAIYLVRSTPSHYTPSSACVMLKR